MVKKVLIVLTSAKAMPWGSDSGFWLEEFAAPFVAFKAQGYQITVAVSSFSITIYNIIICINTFHGISPFTAKFIECIPMIIISLSF